MNSFATIFKSKIFKIGLLVVLFLTSGVVITAVLLGNEAGNFVIQVKNGDPSASVSITTANLADYVDDDGNIIDSKDIVLSSMLTAPGLTNFIDYTPERFLSNDYADLKDFTNRTGSNYQGDSEYGYSLYGYTFYIVNTGSSAINLKVNLTYSKVTNYLDEIIRCMTYCENRSGSKNSSVYIYQKLDDTIDLNGNKLAYLDNIDGYVNLEYFTEEGSSSGVVYNDEGILLTSTTYSDDGIIKNGSFVKYSVLFWLEGNDKDSDYYGNKLLGGSIKFDLEVEVSNN